jgi:hypothetical protein
MITLAASGNDVLHFFQHFFEGATDGWVVVWGKDRRTNAFKVTDLEGAAAKLTELAAKGDTYVGRGLQATRPTGGSRGDENGVTFVSGIFVDVDTREGPHKTPAKELPADANEALALVREAGLPEPTVIIHTGGGVHLHWTYTAPVMLVEEEERTAEKALAEGWLARLRTVFKAHGYKLDGVADLCRVCKAPGTWNHKTNPAKPVRLVTMGERVERADALSIVATELKVTTRVEGKAGGVSALLNDQAKKAAIVKAKPDNLASVLAGCAWMRHCEADAANLSEPQWHGMLGISGRCENGRELSHKLSEPYPGYTPEETDEKLQHALNDAGPVTCNKVAGEFGFEDCARCPARGITSPMNFADQAPALVRDQVRYVYVVELRRYFNVATGKLLTPESFADGVQARVGAQAHSKMMSSRTTGKVDALDFRPGDPRLIIRNEDGSSVVNTWRQGGVQPAAGDPKPILDFFARFIPDTRSRDHVIQYLAHLVRHPSVKIEHAVVITGGYGTGKGTLRDILNTMFGLHNVQKIEGDELSDRNNSKWVNCQTLFFEETEQGDKLEVYRRLKELITGDTYRVQDKYIPTYEGRSPRGIFMVSNDSTPVMAKPNERRYFFCDTPETPETDEEVEANRAYFAGLRKVLNRDNSAVAAFMHHLATAVDLSNFAVKGRPPTTAAKKRAIQESRTPAAAVLADLIAAGAPPFNRDLVTARQAIDAIEAAGWGRTLERMSMKKMADVFRSVGGYQVNYEDGDHKQVRVTRDLAPRLWGIRNKAQWQNAPAADLRNEWLGGKPAAEAEVVVVQLRANGMDRVIAKAV